MKRLRDRSTHTEKQNCSNRDHESRGDSYEFNEGILLIEFNGTLSDRFIQTENQPAQRRAMSFFEESRGSNDGGGPIIFNSNGHPPGQSTTAPTDKQSLPRKDHKFRRGSYESKEGKGAIILLKG
ncbi:hypothetical protein MFRU_005g01040 [Monilinia fructicola]|uniref:Uncharacterized protein n=1 Tax=Monilinia fructicola TaxID=38448 RepID=A0A5M9JQ67_MONFR|nr:hypothetical protein EYC84_002290 [Monilinia fructicola]KAG4033087.1 hypothetical protein MFRU_005g01040 [Monilinia fructicola]